MFVPEAHLKDSIIEILLTEEQSISKLHRELCSRGGKIHKLVLTGYLQSLSDMGILKEKSIPPSKVYSVAAAHTRNIYGIVGDTVSMCSPKRDRDPMVLYTLQNLFHRHVFRFEIARSGANVCRDAVEADRKSLQETRKLVSKQGIKVPPNEPAYTLADEHAGERYANIYSSILEDIVLEITSSIALRKSTKQTLLTP